VHCLALGTRQVRGDGDSGGVAAPLHHGLTALGILPSKGLFRGVSSCEIRFPANYLRDQTAEWALEIFSDYPLFVFACTWVVKRLANIPGATADLLFSRSQIFCRDVDARRSNLDNYSAAKKNRPGARLVQEIND
jgi:hypothetical protein